MAFVRHITFISLLCYMAFDSIKHKILLKELKLVGGNLKSLKWLSVLTRRSAHQRLAEQKAIKGNVLEHFNTFNTSLSQLHSCDIRKGFSKTPSARH